MEPKAVRAVIDDALRFRDQQIALVPLLERQEADQQRQLERTEGQLREANKASGRFDSFEGELDGDLQCPKCWISHGSRQALTPTTGNASVDRFRCHSCGYVLEVQI